MCGYAVACLAYYHFQLFHICLFLFLCFCVFVRLCKSIRKVSEIQSGLPFHAFQIIRTYVYRRFTVDGYGSFNEGMFELPVTCAVLPVQIPSL
jgi:hypothetical protein